MSIPDGKYAPILNDAAKRYADAVRAVQVESETLGSMIGHLITQTEAFGPEQMQTRFVAWYERAVQCNTNDAAAVNALVADAERWIVQGGVFVSELANVTLERAIDETNPLPTLKSDWGWLVPVVICVVLLALFLRVRG